MTPHESVAKALYETPDEGYAWELNADNATQALYRQQARTAIESLREGADVRLKAAITKRYGGVPADVIIHEYVDAILGYEVVVNG